MPTTLFQDSFTRADSATTLGTPTEVGGAWTAVNGTWGVSTNSGYSVTDAAGNIAVTPNLGASDYTVSVDMKGTITGASWREPQLVVRYTDANNFIFFVNTGTDVQLYKKDAGTVSYLNIFGSAVTSNDTIFNIKAVCTGANIKVYINSVLKIDTTLTGANATKFSTGPSAGMRLDKGGSPAFAARWDNFLIDPISSATPVSISSAVKSNSSIPNVALKNSMLVSDSFNRADSTTTLGTTDGYTGGTSKTWTAVVGTWGISTNKAYNPSATTDSYAVVDSSLANVKISASLTYATAEIGLYFRTTDANNRFRVIYSGGKFVLQRKVTGTQTNIGNWAVTKVDGDVLRVECNGNLISVYLNNTLLGSVTDSFNNTATSHGIGFGVSDSSARLDNFFIEDFSTSTSTSISSTVKSNSAISAVTLRDTRTLLSTIISTSSISAVTLQDTQTLLSTVKSNSTIPLATLLDSRTFLSTIKSNSTIPSATLTLASAGIFVSSTVKSNSSIPSVTLKDTRTLLSTSKSTSAVSAALSDSRALTSTIKGNSTIPPVALSALKKISSTIKGNSTIPTIALGTLKAVSSTIKGNSTIPTSSLTVTAGSVTISSKVKSNSTIPAVTLKDSRALLTTIKSTSTISGVLSDSRSIISTIKGNSSISTISLVNLRAVSSTVKSTSTIPTTSLTVAAGLITISSKIKSNSTISAVTLKDSRALATTVKSTSNISNITLLDSRQLGATIKGNSTVTANLSDTRALSGSVKGTSTVTGAVAKTVKLTSTIKGNSSITSTTIRDTISLSASVKGTSGIPPASLTVNVPGALVSTVKSKSTVQAAVVVSIKVQTVTKSTSNLTAKATVVKAVSSTTKSNATISTPSLLNLKPISTTIKSTSSTKATSTITAGTVYILGSTKSTSGVTGKVNVAKLAQTTVKSTSGIKISASVLARLSGTTSSLSKTSAILISAPSMITPKILVAGRFTNKISITGTFTNRTSVTGTFTNKIPIGGKWS